MSETRIPTQKRSIEKRNKIIEKGFELMCEKGYYNTNTQQIAEYAGVSTGIIYQYFNDKKEIFIEGVKNYSNTILYHEIDILSTQIVDFNNIEKILKSMIEKFIETHTFSKKAHEELMAMSHLDDDVSEIFKNSELNMTKKIVELLSANNITIPNINERVHIAIGLVDNLCHEIVYHKHEHFNYNSMTDEVITIIKNLLFDQNNIVH